MGFVSANEEPLSYARLQPDDTEPGEGVIFVVSVSGLGERRID